MPNRNKNKTNKTNGSSQGKNGRRSGETESAIAAYIPPRGIFNGTVHPAPLRSLGPVGFPRKLRVTHKYCDTVSFASSGGTPGAYVFTCNNLFDPNYTIGGHQPLYFDQLGTIYNHFTVFSSRIRITLTAVTGNTTSYVSLTVDDDTTPPSTIVQAVEQSNGRGAMTALEAYRPLVLENSWNAKEWFGGDVFDNDQLTGSPAAGPTELCYYVLNAVDSQFTTSITYSIMVEVLYDAVWDEPKTIAIS